MDGKVQVNIPVPVYCRPIFNTNDTTQVKITYLMFIDFLFLIQRFGVVLVLILVDYH
jgi:hypothetical protein